jgi:hypothetical protein
MRVMGESMPGTFRSSIQLVREGSESLRATVPDGVAKVLGAVPDGSLVWTVDLKAGRVTVSAEPPGAPEKKSTKRD